MSNSKLKYALNFVIYANKNEANVGSIVCETVEDDIKGMNLKELIDFLDGAINDADSTSHYLMRDIDDKDNQQLISQEVRKKGKVVEKEVKNLDKITSEAKKIMRQVKKDLDLNEDLSCCLSSMNEALKDIEGKSLKDTIEFLGNAVNNIDKISTLLTKEIDSSDEQQIISKDVRKKGKPAFKKIKELDKITSEAQKIMETINEKLELDESLSESNELKDVLFLQKKNKPNITLIQYGRMWTSSYENEQGGGGSGTRDKNKTTALTAALRMSKTNDKKVFIIIGQEQPDGMIKVTKSYWETF